MLQEQRHGYPASRAGIPPSQNGVAAPLELLNGKLVASVAMDQGWANRWRKGPNTLSPHSALQEPTAIKTAQATAA